MKAKMLAKVAIVLALAIAHVTNDWVSDVFEVFTYLVRATSERDGFHQSVTLKACQQLDVRDGGLSTATFCVAHRVVHGHLGQCVTATNS